MPLLPLSLSLRIMTSGVEYLFGQFGTIFQSVFPPSVLPTPSLIPWGKEGVNESPDAVGA